MTLELVRCFTCRRRIWVQRDTRSPLKVVSAVPGRAVVSVSYGARRHPQEYESFLRRRGPSSVTGVCGGGDVERPLNTGGGGSSLGVQGQPPAALLGAAGPRLRGPEETPPFSAVGAPAVPLPARSGRRRPRARRSLRRRGEAGPREPGAPPSGDERRPGGGAPKGAEGGAEPGPALPFSAQ